jgi:hypothetical protein
MGFGSTQRRKSLTFLREKLSGLSSFNIPGDALLSHKVSLAVPSAQEVLTAVFGMGTGVAPPLMSPGSSFEYLAHRPLVSSGLRFAEAPKGRRRVHVSRVRRETLLSVNFMVKPHGRLVPVS